MVCKKASLLLNVNTLVGKNRTDSIFIYIKHGYCPKKLVQNAHSCPKQELTNFATPQGGLPPPTQLT